MHQTHDIYDLKIVKYALKPAKYANQYITNFRISTLNATKCL